MSSVRALALGLLPACFSMLLAGAWLSMRAQARVAEVNQRVQRIVAGDLRERLPHRDVDEPFSKLAAIVNGMLDEMEKMIHALRRGGQRHRPRSANAADAGAARARARPHQRDPRWNNSRRSRTRRSGNIDHSLTIVTALLRLAEIENSRRSAGPSGMCPCTRCCARSAISTNRSPKTRTSTCKSRCGQPALRARRPGSLARGRWPISSTKRHQVHARRRQCGYRTVARRRRNHHACDRYRQRHNRAGARGRAAAFPTAPTRSEACRVWGWALIWWPRSSSCHGFRLAIHSGQGGRLEIICPRQAGVKSAGLGSPLRCRGYRP